MGADDGVQYMVWNMGVHQDVLCEMWQIEAGISMKLFA